MPKPLCAMDIRTLRISKLKVAASDRSISAPTGAVPHSDAESPKAGSNSATSSQHTSHMADCPADADVCKRHSPTTMLSHVELAGTMATKPNSCSMHCHVQEGPASSQRADASARRRQEAAMQRTKMPISASAITYKSTSRTTLTPSYSQTRLNEQPAANDAGQLADTQQAYPLGPSDPPAVSPPYPPSSSASAYELSAVSSSGQLRQHFDGASSCPAGADLGDRHSTGDEQAPAPVSAKSGAEQQVLLARLASYASEAAMSSTPAGTISSKVTSPT